MEWLVETGDEDRTFGRGTLRRVVKAWRADPHWSGVCRAQNASHWRYKHHDDRGADRTRRVQRTRSTDRKSVERLRGGDDGGGRWNAWAEVARVLIDRPAPSAR